MHKFKVGDILVSKNREEDIIEVVKTSDNKMNAYAVVAVEGSRVGDMWYYDGHYMWSQRIIESNYQLVEPQPQLTFDEYMKKFSNLQNELSILDSRNTLLDSRTKMKIEQIETLEKSIESLREEIKNANKHHSDNVARKLEIMNEIIELNKQFGGQ